MKMKHMKPYTTMKTVLSTLAIALAFGPLHNAQACTRILYETGNQSYISGRSMDWAGSYRSDGAVGLSQRDETRWNGW